MANAIGMSVPGASNLYGPPSLSDQVNDETEEQRKKRLQNMAAARQLPSGASPLAGGYSSALSTT